MDSSIEKKLYMTMGNNITGLMSAASQPNVELRSNTQVVFPELQSIYPREEHRRMHDLCNTTQTSDDSEIKATEMIVQSDIHDGGSGTIMMTHTPQPE